MKYWELYVLIVKNVCQSGRGMILRHRWVTI